MGQKIVNSPLMDQLEIFFSTDLAPTIMLDKAGKITFANLMAQELLCLNHEMIQDQSYSCNDWNHVHMDGSPCHESEWPLSVILRSGKAISNLRHGLKWPDGNTKYLSISGAPILRNEKNEIEKVVFLLTDITSEILEGKKLQEDLNYFQEVLSKIDVGVQVYTADGGMFYQNEQSQKILNSTLENLDRDFVKNNQTEWKVVREDETPCPVSDSPVAKALTHKKAFLGEVNGISPPDNSWFKWIMCSAVPLFKQSGEVKYVLCTIVDMTEQRHLQERLWQLNKMEALGRMASGISHDFNNILTVLWSQADFLEAHTKGDPQGQKYVSVLQSAVTHAVNVCNQLLGFARSGRGSPAALDVVNSVQKLKSLFPADKDQSDQLAFQLPEEKYFVNMDANQFDQVMINLINNARDSHKNKGMVTVTCRKVCLQDNISVATGSVEKGAYAVIEVLDEGEGISSENKKKIFDPFFTTKKIGKGTGLGLSISLGHVQRAKGNIEVLTNEPKGSIFRIYLPLL